MRRILVSVAASVAVFASLVTMGAGASASTGTTVPRGELVTAVQNTFLHRVTVHGWAYDPRRSASSIPVKVYVDKHYAGAGVADVASPGLDAGYHITGAHDFTITVPWTPIASVVTIVSSGVYPAEHYTILSSRNATHYWPPPGDRIVYIAHKYVGYRYTEGGSSPSTGFDCSGYSMYVYSTAHVASLAHNAETQRRSMKLLSPKYARPGDLVFYLSGGTAYHVAIYAGNHMQYAAATPSDGVRYQAVWSSAVEYRTDWH